MAEQGKSLFEIIVDLIKAVIWPIIIVLFFCFYGKELGKIITLIPKEIERSSKISVGSVTLEIEKTAKSTGNEELGVIIKNLSEKGIRKLLTLGSGIHSIMVRSKISENSTEEDAYSLPVDIDVLKELEKNRLLKIDEPIDEFIKYFKQLNPIERVWYDDINGSSSTVPRDSFNIKRTELILPISKLNSKDHERIDRYGLQLSESGKKAFEIIVHVVAQQISNG